MPYNMQLQLLKSEESESFYREHMYTKEKEINSLTKQVHSLEKKWEEAYQIQHDMENAIEEYEVNTKKWEESLKSTSRKFQELQKKCTQLEKINRDLEAKWDRMEQEKWKLSEKWIRLSAKNKNDDKVRIRLKEVEKANEKKDKEVQGLTEKLNKNERENAMLRRANDSLQTTVSQQVKKIKKMQSSNKENDSEKEITDQITSELIEKINQYEGMIEELRIENDQLSQELQNYNGMSEKLVEYETYIHELEYNNQNLEQFKNEESNKKLLEIKEECLIKESENLRLKEKNEYMQQQIHEFKQEFDSLQDYVNLKDDQIRNKFKDEEVCICTQMLLKELISVNKKQALNFLGIDQNVGKGDLKDIIKSNYLTDSFVRFVIVNSVAYLQECKESLNYLKQKYAESELKYDNIIEKYQNWKNEKTNLLNNTAILENNVSRLMDENQRINEEKFQIMKTCIANQSPSPSQMPSFIQSYDGANLHNVLQSVKENISMAGFNDISRQNISINKAPLTSRVQKNENMSVDQSQMLRNGIRMSQNYSTIQRNTSVLSNRVSWDGLNKDLNISNTQKGTMLCNKKKSYWSTASISFYKPQNPQRFSNIDGNRSSVSIRNSVISQNNDTQSNRQRSVLRSIDTLPERQRNNSRASKHHRKNALNSKEQEAQKGPAFGVSSNKGSYIEKRLKSSRK